MMGLLSCACAQVFVPPVAGSPDNSRELDSSTFKLFEQDLSMIMIMYLDFSSAGLWPSYRTSSLVAINAGPLRRGLRAVWRVV